MSDTGKKRGRPRIHASDKERKRAYDQRRRAAKRGAALVDDPPESSNDKPLTVTARVVEQPEPVLDVPAPVGAAGAGVPEAGSENGAVTPTGSAGTTSPKEADGVALDPAVMVSLTKGVFALVALRGGEHWNVTEEEIEPIAEPMCRQAMRIPIVAALGQDAADLILIGSTLGALIFMRAQQSVEERKRLAEQRTLGPVRRGVVGRGNVVELRPEPGRTDRVAAAEGGERYEEVREPNEPRINLGPFQQATS